MNHSRRADRRQYIRLMLRFRADQKRALKARLSRLVGTTPMPDHTPTPQSPAQGESRLYSFRPPQRWAFRSGTSWPEEAWLLIWASPSHGRRWVYSSVASPLSCSVWPWAGPHG